MFYCETCRAENDWPESLIQSHGKCELCDFVGQCHDRSSKDLPSKAEPEVSLSIMHVAELMNKLLKQAPTDTDRENVIYEILDGICIHCGRVCSDRCHCMNDE